MRNFDTLPETAHLTVKDIASWLGISKATVWRWKTAGILPKPTKFSARCTRWMCGDIRRVAGIAKPDDRLSPSESR